MFYGFGGKVSFYGFYKKVHFCGFGEKLHFSIFDGKVLRRKMRFYDFLSESVFLRF